jgi:hypothetical protein
MFAEDRSAEQPLSTLLRDAENRWRAGVRRFRRGGPRIAAGFALIGRGIGDLFAGLPAVLVIGCVLLLVWLERHVALVRLGLSWLLGAHRIFFAGLRAAAAALARLWRPLGLGALGVTAVLVLTPSLGIFVGAVSQSLEWLGALDLPTPTLPPPPELPELELREFWYSVGAFIERAAYVCLVVAIVLAAGIAAVLLVSYAAFTLFVIARAIVLGLVALARAVWRAIAWLVRGVFTAIHGFARLIAWLIMTVVRAVLGLATSIVRALRWTAERGVRGAAWSGRASVGLSLATVVAAWRLARALVGGLVTLCVGATRLVWRHVFRLFAFSGSIAALAFTAWAIRSMREGRPLPTSLSELAASTVYGAAALLVVFATFGILAATALAIRRAPPRLVRAAGLAALVLLAFAPTPFLLRALWNSGPAEELRAAFPDLLAAVLDLAPMLLFALAALATVWLVARALVWLARNMSPDAWRRTARVALATGAVVAVAGGGVWLWKALPRDAIASGIGEAAGAAVGIAAAILPIAAGLAAAVLAVAAALWLLARTPERLKRTAMLAVLALAALSALGFGGALAWRRIDPPLLVAATTDGLASRWRIWNEERQRRADAERERRAAADERAAAMEPIAETSATPQVQLAETDVASPPPPVPAIEPNVALAELKARRIFPADRDLHWRFGDARLLGDGLTAFEPVEGLLGGIDVCGARAVVALGMASSEGPAPFNDGLSSCRADRLAALARRSADTCAEPGSIRVFTLSLGESSADGDSAADRRALVFAVDDDAALDAATAAALDPVVEGHSGVWELEEFSEDAAACEALD